MSNDDKSPCGCYTCVCGATDEPTLDVGVEGSKDSSEPNTGVKAEISIPLRGKVVGAINEKKPIC